MDTRNPVQELKKVLKQTLSHTRTDCDVLNLPLSEVDLLADINQLKEFNDQGVIQDFKFCLECATKDILYEIIATGPYQQGVSNRDAVLLPLFRLLDLVLLLSETELCEQTLPLSIIEETLDSQTIGGCQQVFSYLESRFERLTAGVDGSKGKGLVLLRLSNELLRRLSKSEDTVFCGRILVFLSKSFPLSERSGVNLRGEFNVDNVTNFEGANMEGGLASAMPTALDKGDDDTMPIATDGEQDEESIRPQVFYPAFWSMQSHFADPTRLFKAHHLENFKTALKTTLRAFKLVADEQTHHGASYLKSDYQGDSSRIEDSLDHYNPKYLTSRELFELEVRDLVFRRHVLVQAFILIEFLLTLSPESKKKWDTDAKNRSVQYSFTLSDEDLRWAEESKRDISISLQQEKGMDGLLFSRTVDSVLTREKNWVKWKADNCVSFEKPTLKINELEEPRDTAISACQAPQVLRNGLGAPALSKVWMDLSVGDTLIDLEPTERYEVPDYRTFHRRAEQIELDMDFVSTAEEKDELNGVCSSLNWRALRLASKDRFHLFNKLDDDLNLRSLLVADESVIKEKNM